jgi:hypothetical protein
VNVPFNMAGDGQVWLVAALLLLLALVLARMMRSKKPDPKMELLLTLMKDFPMDDGG